MKIEAGKYYRTRCGKKAYVHVVYGINPFDNSHLPYPVSGCVGTHWVRWTERGKYSSTDTENNYDLVAEWSESVPMYRAFANENEFWPFRNEWVIKPKDSKAKWRISGCTESGVWVCLHGFVAWPTLFEEFTFANGSRCGVKNN